MKVAELKEQYPVVYKVFWTDEKPKQDTRPGYAKFLEKKLEIQSRLSTKES